MDREIEQDLLERLQRGDAAAFDALYDHYRPRIFGYLLRLGGRRELAEDLTQECFLRLASRAASLREGSRLRPWLFTVAHNLFVSHQRWRLLDAERIGELARLQILDEQLESPFEHTAGSEMERRLERALAALPVRDREVLLLVAIEGLSPSEAAAICELKPEAFRKRLSRARARLVGALGGVPDPGPSEVTT
ncbi:MAG: RNA polymerase sigma factor [Deltaproteobacteria bacterium]|nr:RNA polymerase sigma factor [Deltaproteobacteria bacterium]